MPQDDADPPADTPPADAEPPADHEPAPRAELPTFARRRFWRGGAPRKPAAEPWWRQADPAPED